MVGTVYYKGKASNHRHFSRVESKQTGHCEFSGSLHWSSGIRRESPHSSSGMHRWAPAQGNCSWGSLFLS